MTRAVASTIEPRGLSRERAAEYCGLTVTAFSAMVADKKLPDALPFGRRVKTWDRAALDRALDTLSRLAAPKEGDEWMARLNNGKDGQAVRSGR